MKPGRVVIMLAGKYAGRKAMVVKIHDEKKEDFNLDKKFQNCIVVGIRKYPRKVTRRMSKKRVEKYCRVKPFVKYVNMNHMICTRYLINIDDDLKNKISEDKMKDVAQRKEMRKDIKDYLNGKYAALAVPQNKEDKTASHVEFFFKKLKF